MKTLRQHITIILSCLSSAMIVGSCSFDERISIHPDPQDGSISFEFVSDPMRRLKVGTKASDLKEDAEKQIHNLHIFFFDENGEYLLGSYLTGYPDATADGGYYSPGEGVNTLKIANQESNFFGSDGYEKAKNATIYAVANVHEQFFNIDPTTGRPENVTCLADLEEMSYPGPGHERIFQVLPETGMPMAARIDGIDLTGTTGQADAKRTILLKALMARVDINLKIRSDISGNNGRPSFTMTGWKAHNLPEKTTLREQGYGNPTNHELVEISDETIREIQTANNGDNGLSISFYMFENLQKGFELTQDNYINFWAEHGFSKDDFSQDNNTLYPDGVVNNVNGADRRQNYKPLLGLDTAHSAAVELYGYYSTYNDENYDATYLVHYTLYLGSNHINNFEVMRNHQYKNDITVKGLIANDQHDKGDYTFDARVNIDDTEYNNYYISMLRERNHDAHFCVTPMDVYMFAPASDNPKIIVRLDHTANQGSDKNGTPWLRMERISGEDMQNGTLTESGDAVSDNTHLIAGANFTAGHGKRRYFTTDLVSSTLKDNIEISIEKTTDERDYTDRIYFYLDENLEKDENGDLKDRTATVSIEYYENDELVSSRTLEITQVHLLPVDITENNDGTGDFIRTIYMEQFEEYLDHYDPLDTHNPDLIFSGLPWQSSPYDNSRIPTLHENRGDALNIASNSNWGEASQVFLYGFQYTNFVIYYTSQTIHDLNTKVVSAFQYCHNRNKRDNYGNVPDPGYSSTIIGEIFPSKPYFDNNDNSNYGKWFLPGIREMEQSLIKYFNIFPEFQTDFYWSASAGEEYGGTSGQENDRARATAIKNPPPTDPDENPWYESGGGGRDGGEKHAYEIIENGVHNGGYAYRNVPLRIRAFRIDLEPVYSY